MAYSCNPATWRLDRVAGLSSEVLLYVVLWRSGVRTKSGINMVGWRELQLTRLTNEGRLGRGRKRSRQKSPCRTVVGSRRWIGRVQHSVQYNRTSIFFIFKMRAESQKTKVYVSSDSRVWSVNSKRGATCSVKSESDLSFFCVFFLLKLPFTLVLIQPPPFFFCIQHFNLWSNVHFL